MLRFVTVLVHHLHLQARMTGVDRSELVGGTVMDRYEPPVECTRAILQIEADHAGGILHAPTGDDVSTVYLDVYAGDSNTGWRRRVEEQRVGVADEHTTRSGDTGDVT